MKSERNKTIDISLEEGGEYLEKCVKSACLPKGNLLNKIINADLFEAVKYIPEKSVDLLITDPPYNINKAFGDMHFTEKSRREYLEYTEKWLDAVMSLLKDTASVYVCCDWKSSSVIEEALRCRLNIRNRITWQREKGRGAGANWKNGMEDIWYGTVSNDYTFNLDAVKLRKKVVAPYKNEGVPKDWEETENGNFRNTCPSNFWDDISIPYWSMPENTAHPTQKPEKLMAKLILASSNEGDTVLDIFSGSGTTAVTSKKLKRNFIGVEINPEYCIWSEIRLERAENDRSIQGYSDGVFWERNTFSAQKKYKSKQ